MEILKPVEFSIFLESSQVQKKIKERIWGTRKLSYYPAWGISNACLESLLTCNKDASKGTQPEENCVSPTKSAPVPGSLFPSQQQLRLGVKPKTRQYIFPSPSLSTYSSLSSFQ